MSNDKERRRWVGQREDGTYYSLDPVKGEFMDEDGRIKICRACKPNSKVTRHTCGLAGLQDLLRF